MRLEELNALDAASAERELQRCCSSSRWARLMAAARPFASAGEITATADRIWTSMEPRDWLQAFAAHPRIGQPTRSSWEAAEQAGVTDGAGGGHGEDHTLAAAREKMDKLNRAYEQRFGHIFIVCATGKTADEVLRLLEERLRNNPDEELRVAAHEQRQITRLRLAKWLT